MNSARLAPVVGVLICLATWFGAGPAVAAGSVTATATIDGRSIGDANASNPVRLEPTKVTLVVVEVKNETAKAVSVRRVDLTGHVIGLNFFSYSTSVELTIAAGKTEKLTYRLDPAGLDGQATGLIGSDLTVIGSDGEPVAGVHTVIDVRGSLMSVYGLFGIILAVLTMLAIADAALSVARHRLSVNRWQRGLRLLAPGVGIGLMAGFTASVARWWVPGAGLWLALAGVTATVFFLAGYLSPTPRQSDDLGLDPEDLAAARELDAQGFTARSADEPNAAGAPAPDYAGAGVNAYPGAPDPSYNPSMYNTGGQRFPTGPTQHIPGGPTPSFPGGPTQTFPSGPTQTFPSGPTRRVPGGPTPPFPSGATQRVPSARDQPPVAGPPTASRGFGWRASGASDPEVTIGRTPDLAKPVGKPEEPADDAETKGWESGTMRKADPHADEQTIRDRPGGTQRFRPGGAPE